MKCGKVSVALATYNGARFLPDQLRSFLEQSRLPDELVVSDDASTDETLILLREFQKKAPFTVRLIVNKTNVGYTGNFNRALQATTGDIVFPSDQDDFWLPDKIKLMTEFFQSHPNFKVVLCDESLADEDLVNVGITKLQQLKASHCPKSYFVDGCCMAISQDFLDLVLPIPDSFRAHDIWIARIAEGLGLKAIIEQPLVIHRRHGKNASHFIASELRRVNFLKRLSYLLRELQEAVGSGNVRREKMQYMLVQEEMLLEGAKRVTGSIGIGGFGENTFELIPQLERRVSIYQCRVRTSELSFPQRVQCVYEMWRRGDYKVFGGVKGVIGDVFFP